MDIYMYMFLNLQNFWNMHKQTWHICQVCIYTYETFFHARNNANNCSFCIVLAVASMLLSIVLNNSTCAKERNVLTRFISLLSWLGNLISLLRHLCLLSPCWSWSRQADNNYTKKKYTESWKQTHLETNTRHFRAQLTLPACKWSLDIT